VAFWRTVLGLLKSAVPASGGPVLREVPKQQWTPRTGAVLATAKTLASPDGGRIRPCHILLALQTGDHIASQVLKDFGINPAASLGRPAPDTWVLTGWESLTFDDFDASLALFFAREVFSETRAMGGQYLGIEHLLLLVARLGVSGLELPYDKMRQRICERMGLPHSWFFPFRI
jgi:hypothetical protein